MLQRQHEQDRPRDHRQSTDDATDARTETTSNERRKDDEARSDENAYGEQGHRHSLLETVPDPRVGPWISG